MFNSILREAGLPPEEVCLLRHQDNRADRGRRPYDLWLKKDGSFEAYQSRQALDARKGPLSRPYWASFVGLPDNETLFVGLFTAKRLGVLERDTPMLYRDGIDKAGSCDVYEVKPLDALSDFVEKLFLDWGPGFENGPNVPSDGTSQ